MCRTGRVFRPEIDGERLDFVLIGALHYNAILEDVRTGSWWYQGTGEAIHGPRRGDVMPEIPSEQMTLAEWLGLHPESDVLQPDPSSEEGYHLFGFNEIDSKRPDPEAPLQGEGENFEWIVGLVEGGGARAYPWSYIEARRPFQDELGGVPIVIFLRSDGISFRAWDRRLKGRVLDFRLDSEGDRIVDAATGSAFGFDGVALDGPLAGGSLRRLGASQEYLHSFLLFHPKADRHEAPPGDEDPPADPGSPAPTAPPSK